MGTGTWRWLPSTKLGCKAPAPFPGSMHALCHQEERSRGPAAAPRHTQVHRIDGLRRSKAYTSTHASQSHSPQRERGSGWLLAAAWHLRTVGREVHTASGFQHRPPLCPMPLLPGGLFMFLGPVLSPQALAGPQLHTHLCYSSTRCPQPPPALPSSQSMPVPRAGDTASSKRRCSLEAFSIFLRAGP